MYLLAKLFFGNLGDFGKGFPYYLVHDSYVKAYGSGLLVDTRFSFLY